MDLSRVDVVLVRPARPTNVAAACRAMKNMGLRSLAIVGAPAGLDAAETRALAYGAWDVLDGAVRKATFREAVAGSTFVAGTSGRAREGAWTPRQLAAAGSERSGGGRIAIVFGPEASGLSDEELAQCHVRVHIPSDPEHPSLNLAQAVLLIAYELRLGSGSGEVAPPDPVRAPAGEIEAALDDLRQALLGIGYLSAASPERILSEWRALIVRAGPTVREISLLRGLARQVLWAGTIARARSGDDNRAPSKGEGNP
jgi:TrmH family RNA methyltransferase